jgi:hypothetical protein
VAGELGLHPNGAIGQQYWGYALERQCTTKAGEGIADLPPDLGLAPETAEGATTNPTSESTWYAAKSPLGRPRSTHISLLPMPGARCHYGYSVEREDAAEASKRLAELRLSVLSVETAKSLTVLGSVEAAKHVSKRGLAAEATTKRLAELRLPIETAKSVSKRGLTVEATAYQVATEALGQQRPGTNTRRYTA